MKLSDDDKFFAFITGMIILGVIAMFAGTWIYAGFGQALIVIGLFITVAFGMILGNS